jgi:hypothetical protein
MDFSKLNKRIHPKPKAPDQSPLSNKSQREGSTQGQAFQFIEELVQASIFSYARENALALVR